MITMYNLIWILLVLLVIALIRIGQLYRELKLWERIAKSAENKAGNLLLEILHLTKRYGIDRESPYDVTRSTQN